MLAIVGDDGSLTADGKVWALDARHKGARHEDLAVDLGIGSTALTGIVRVARAQDSSFDAAYIEAMRAGDRLRWRWQQAGMRSSGEAPGVELSADQRYLAALRGSGERFEDYTMVRAGRPVRA